jgi:hypothetical protein
VHPHRIPGDFGRIVIGILVCDGSNIFAMLPQQQAARIVI